MRNALILLPGMMCDARLFAPQIAHLSDRYDITVPRMDAGATMVELATDILQTAPTQFALGGLSMGGIVAMEIMRQAGDRVTHLALMDTNPYAELDEVKKRRGPQMDKVAAGQLAAVMRDEMKPHYLASGPQKAALLDLCLDMALALGPAAFRAQSLALRDRSDYSATLREVRCSTLLLCGVEDRLCPPERHHAMAEMIPAAQLNIIEGAGHLPSLEQPDQVNAAMDQLLEE